MPELEVAAGDEDAGVEEKAREMLRLFGFWVKLRLE